MIIRHQSVHSTVAPPRNVRFNTLLQLPDDWRDIIEQALTDGPENLFMSDEVLIGRPVRPQPSRENRGMVSLGHSYYIVVFLA